jgi:hypothetical protein
MREHEGQSGRPFSAFPIVRVLRAQGINQATLSSPALFPRLDSPTEPLLQYHHPVMTPQVMTQGNHPNPSPTATDSSLSPPHEPEQPMQPESQPFLRRRPVRLSIYALLALILLLMLGWRFLPGLLDPTFEKHIQSKRVITGMTRAQVLKAWGSPYTMNVSYTKDGIRREEWIFEDWVNSATVKHRYLYFEEDILVGGWYYQ